MATVEEYLELPFVSELDEDTKAEIRKVRTEYEPITSEQFHFLMMQGVIKRTIKLKNKKRSLFVSPEGQILTFDFYNKRYMYIGYFAE